MFNLQIFSRRIVFMLVLLLSVQSYGQITISSPDVEAILYLGKGRNQPLVVGLGGSEGGNAWASDYWKKTRDQFIQKGYAFLAIGYFGAPGTPRILNEIEIEQVFRAITMAAKNKFIDASKIAVVGGSRGADLALLLGSYHKEIKCIVSIVGSNAVFPGHTSNFSTPCWNYQQKQLPYLPVNDAAIPFLQKRNLRRSFEAMLTDTVAVEKAAIRVEKIRAPIFFLSATKDEICPSTEMAEMMVTRLRHYQFKYPVEHKPIEGGHASPLKHFDLIFQFLETHFKK
jgi:uncharacterized protein